MVATSFGQARRLRVTNPKTGRKIYIRGPGNDESQSNVLKTGLLRFYSAHVCARNIPDQ